MACCCFIQIWPKWPWPSVNPKIHIHILSQITSMFFKKISWRQYKNKIPGHSDVFLAKLLHFFYKMTTRIWPKSATLNFSEPLQNNFWSTYFDQDERKQCQTKFYSQQISKKISLPAIFKTFKLFLLGGGFTPPPIRIGLIRPCVPVIKWSIKFLLAMSKANTFVLQ